MDRDSGAVQLLLPLRLAPHSRFSLFEKGANALALDHVRASAAGQRPGLVWLWGGRGVGKSHLLQAACREADAAGRRAMYLPLGQHSPLQPAVLAGLEGLDLVALDDAAAVRGETRWERALFELVNAVLDAERCLLISADVAPREAGFELPDLASRASAAIVYRLVPLDDDGIRAAAWLQARDRGLSFDASSMRYLLERISRDMESVNVWLARLDEASLASRRRITIPLIRDTLTRYGGAGE
jgi:DnaA family protein